MGRTNRIWFRKDVGWWTVTLGGKKIRLAEGRQNKKEAERKFHSLKAVTPQEPEKPSARVADIIESFLAWAKIHRSEETNRNLIWYGQAFSEHSGYVLAKDLKPTHLTRWIDTKTWNQTTQRNARRSIFRAFAWAKEEGLITLNPLHGMRCPQAKTRQRIMTDDEFRLLLRNSDRTFKVLLYALRETGARPKECRTLKWGNVHAETWVLPQHKTAHKTGKARVVFLNAPMRKLMTVLRKTAKTDHVFVNTRGEPWTVNAMRLRITRIKDNTDLAKDVVPYLLRHAWGTNAVIRKVDLVSIAACMGHNSLDMIQRVYVHLADQHEHLQKAMEQATTCPPKPSPASPGQGVEKKSA
jgi:integrase/recombinase XerD